MPHCVALFSGGLDSMLAVRLMQEQSISVEALNFKTVFTCCQDSAHRAAWELDIPLTVISQEADYLSVLKRPNFGYGRGANPCVDCRIYMFQKARDYMRQSGAEFVISGEVIGQRPNSQKRRDLDVIAFHSGLEGRLLRPLSAQLLPETRPEQDGTVDRSRLHGFTGRSRKGLIALAKSLGLRFIPDPSTGCALTEQLFSRKVFDLFQHESPTGLWHYELLQYGRHYRLDDHTKLIVGRHESDNESLLRLHHAEPERSSTLLTPYDFLGPRVLIVGSATAETIDRAGALLLRHTRRQDDRRDYRVEISSGEESRIHSVHFNSDVESWEPVTATSFSADRR